MHQEITAVAEPLMSDVDLGRLLGQRKAFGLMAGRCSAAHAAALKRIRDSKGYIAIAPTWEAFCQQELHVSRVHANRIIKWLEEFGPAYFELSQLIPISPSEYRALAPAISDHRIEANGQAIALIPEKAEEVAAAVEEMRRQSVKEKPSLTLRDRLDALDRQCRKLTGEFDELSRYITSNDREELNAMLVNTIAKLRQIDPHL